MKKILLILILISPFNTFAVIAFDAVTSSICSGCGTSKTISHDPVAIPDTVVGCSMGAANPGVGGISSMTYGGQTMTEITGATLTGVQNGDIAIWYLVNDGSLTASAADFVVTWNNSVPSDFAGIAVLTLTGSGAGDDGTASSQNTADLTLTVPNVASDSWMVDCFFIASDTTVTTSPGTDQTERWDLTLASNRQGTGSTEPSPTADSIMSYTLGGSKAVGYGAAEIKISAGVVGGGEEQPIWHLFQRILNYFWV